VLAQNDDFGRDYLAGLKDVLGSRFEQVVTVATYEVTEPTIDSRVVKLKASDADVFLIAATPKFAAQAIRKTHEIGWKPTRFLSNVSIWISSVLEVAGLEASTGIVSTAFAKDPMDPTWSEDRGVKDWRAFMAKYAPEGNIRDQNNVFGTTLRWLSSMCSKPLETT
jgi:branched-chain amino acid transport system substrate-binding protein